MTFGSGRGDRIHMVEDKELNNKIKYSACGVHIDTVLEDRFADKSKFCGNCVRTKAYANAQNSSN